MSESDRQEVAQLRGQLTELRPRMKAMHRSLKQAHKQGAEPTESQKSEMEQLHTERKAIMESARELAKKYESEMRFLHEEVKVEAEQWRKDLRAIAEKHKSDDEPGNKGMKQMHHKLKKHVRPAHFILMDPNASHVPFHGDEDDMGSIQSQPIKDRVVKLYPNPSNGVQTLEYEVVTSGDVQIDLVSKDGDLIKQVYRGYQEAGVHSMNVDNQNLRANVYYYNISDASGKTLKQFVISK